MALKWKPDWRKIIVQLRSQSPREAQLANAGRGAFLTVAAPIAAGMLVNGSEIPTDAHMYVWIGGIVVFLVGCFLVHHGMEQSRGPWDTKLMGRAGVQAAGSLAVLFVCARFLSHFMSAMTWNVILIVCFYGIVIGCTKFALLLRPPPTRQTRARAH